MRPSVAGIAAWALLAPGVAFGQAEERMGAEAGFFDRFRASFAGGGTVTENAAAVPYKVDCELDPRHAGNRLSFHGNCQALAIFSRRIGAELAFDPMSGRYSGTYVGSPAGPAALNGRREGDTLELVVTWAKPVNGDRRAAMAIRNDGRGNLRIRVTDSRTPGGPPMVITDLSFRAH